LLVGGNLIKKLLFPAEVLPVVSVLSNGVHFLLGLPVYMVFWLVFKPEAVSLHALWLPVVIFVQLVFTLGLALFLAAMAVHFRDIRDILANVLTLWFFMTPIIYPLSFVAERAPWYITWVISYLNPMSHILNGYHTAIFEGALIPWKRLPVTLAVAVLLFFVGYFFFDRLRDSFPEEV
jgi:ABC-type polysaccharide/polyol phosphate export permease